MTAGVWIGLYAIGSVLTFCVLSRLDDLKYRTNIPFHILAALLWPFTLLLAVYARLGRRAP
jgi:hypothetical protein